jgi:hypothetical protein
MLRLEHCIRRHVGIVAALVAVLVPSVPRSQEVVSADESYLRAHVRHVDQQLAVAQNRVRMERVLLNGRGEELLSEIAVRLEAREAAIPSGRTAIVPPSITKLNRQERVLSGEVFAIESGVLDQLSNIQGLRDSLVDGLRKPKEVLALVDEIAKAIDTDLGLWGMRVEKVRRELIRDGRPDEARSLFVREYNSVSMMYVMGRYGFALERFRVLTGPYGRYPLRRWIESVPFYMAECHYALGAWDSAYIYYRKVWQDERNLYGRVAFLNWTELAFSAARYSDIATVWAARPRLPEDPLEANRVRLLVAEAFLRQDDPAAAARVLSELSAKRGFLPGEEDILTPEDLEGLEARNSRLLMYGHMLRAEAYLSSIVEPREAEATASAQKKLIDDPEMSGMLIPSEIPVEVDIASVGAIPEKELIKIAYSVAEGSRIRVTDKNRDHTIEAIRELEELLPKLGAAERGDGLMARTLISLGQLYFHNHKWENALKAYRAIPLTSHFYPQGLLGQAWTLMEMTRYEDAKIMVNAAGRWPLVPSASLEASALRSHVLTLMGKDKEAQHEILTMIEAVDLEQRRAASTHMATRIQRITEGLRFVGVVALERQNRTLFLQVLEEQAQLDSLRKETARVNGFLFTYASGALDTLTEARKQIRREEQLMRRFESKLRALRRRAGSRPAKVALPELTLQERQQRLRQWLKGIQPASTSFSAQMYDTWAEYAEFAYAKRIFNRNQRMRENADDLKGARKRIERLYKD